MRRGSLLLAVTLAAALGVRAAAPLAAQTRSVSLPDAIRLAEQSQPRVIQAQANVETADARLRTTRAAYLPNLSFSSSGSNFHADGPARLNPNTNEVVPGGSSSTSLNTNLSANVDLFTGFRRGADIGAARATSEAAVASLVIAP